MRNFEIFRWKALEMGEVLLCVCDVLLVAVLGTFLRSLISALVTTCCEKEYR